MPLWHGREREWADEAKPCHSDNTEMFQAPLNVLKRLMQACRRNPWGIGGVGCFIPSSDGPFLFSISNYQRSESRRRIRVTVWREHTCQRPLRSEDRAEKDRSCLCTYQECPICENKRKTDKDGADKRWLLDYEWYMGSTMPALFMMW